MGTHRIDHRRHDRHGVAVGREGIEVQIHRPVQSRVLGQPVPEVVTLRLSRQLAENEQPCRLHEGDLLLGKGLDWQTPIGEHSLLTVDPGDGRPARGGVGECRVESRHVAGHLTKIRDVDDPVAGGADEDGEGVLLAVENEGCGAALAWFLTHRQASCRM